jgi:hypothetical protein
MLERAPTSFTKKCLGVFSNEWNVSFCQLRNISSYTVHSYTAIQLHSYTAIQLYSYTAIQLHHVRKGNACRFCCPPRKYKSHDVTHLHRPSGTKLNMRGFLYSLCSAILNFVHLFQGLALVPFLPNEQSTNHAESRV